MRAKTNQHKNFRLDRTIRRIDVSRLNRCLGFRVREVAGNLFQVAQNFFCTANDEHGLAAPLSD